MPSAASRHADPFSTRATMLSTSFDGGGDEGNLMRLMGWKDRSMLGKHSGHPGGARCDREISTCVFHAESVGYCGEAGALTGSNSKSCWSHRVNDEVEVSRCSNR